MIDLNNKLKLFSFSIFLSQIISNVPSTIFITHFSSNWRIISYGVNIGGLDLLLAH